MLGRVADGPLSRSQPRRNYIDRCQYIKNTLGRSGLKCRSSSRPAGIRCSRLVAGRADFLRPFQALRSYGGLSQMQTLPPSRLRTCTLCIGGCTEDVEIQAARSLF